MEVDPAYDAMIQATKKYNKDNVVKAIKTYLKCKPDTTYVEIEKAIIATGGVMHVIAVDRKLEPQYTFVSLQGKPGCKYEAQIHPFEQPRRKGQKLSWPKNRQENLDRLKKAGDLGVTSEMICSACNGAHWFNS